MLLESLSIPDVTSGTRVVDMRQMTRVDAGYKQVSRLGMGDRLSRMTTEPFAHLLAHYGNEGRPIGHDP